MSRSSSGVVPLCRMFVCGERRPRAENGLVQIAGIFTWSSYRRIFRTGNGSVEAVSLCGWCFVQIGSLYK